MIRSEFRCLRCNHFWIGRRVLFGPDGQKWLDTFDCPGPTDCPKCKSRYVHWISVKEDMAAVGMTAAPHWNDHPYEDLEKWGLE